jgi:MFS family permease
MPIDLLARLGQMPQFAALRHRDFRLLWVATLLSSTARWADVVVVGWLTLELTDSPFWVGIVSAAKMVGYLAAPFMGVVIDRMDRRMLLLVAAGVNLAAAAAMFLLFITGWLELWHVIVLALFSGLTWALDNPTRNAFVPDLVGSENLTNAIALNAVALEITVIVGPALGGLLIPILGMAGAYGLMSLILLGDVVVLLMMKKDVRQGIAHEHEPPAKSLVSGLRYVWGNQTVLVLMVMAFLLNLLAAPYRYAFLPVFARYILDAGPTGYGMLTAMAGVGALVGGVWVVSLGNYQRKGRLLVWSSIVWPVSVLVFAISTWYSVSMALMFVAGLTQGIVWTMIATLILANTAQSMRGRVMGIRTGVVIGLPLGNFLAGALAESFGAPIAQGAYAVASILAMLAIVRLSPNLRKLD